MSRNISRFFFQQSLLALSLLTAACGGGNDSGSGSHPGATGSSSSATPTIPTPSSAQQYSSASSSNGLVTPANLHSNEISATSVSLTWDAVSMGAQAVQYRITRNGQIVATTDTPTYTDKGLEPGQQYLYRIQSGITNWSAYTGALAVRTASDGTPTNSSSSASGRPGELPYDDQPPSIPAGFQATNIKDTRIDLAWQATHDNVGVSVYEVYRNGSLVATISGRELAYLDQNLTADTRYTYTLRARDSAGNTSRFSLPLDIQTTSPLSNSGVKLAWQHPQQRQNGRYLELSEIQGYELRYRPDSLSAYTVIAIPGNTTTTYTSKSLPSSWDFEIAVYDNKGLYSEFVALPPR
jgi:chitodextrinase